ncbi:uncharacterized protein DNG_05901 [Cephalotrichum gorgonifer]|uniref:UBL3-like ubiquitin domain-containing protein n=1 Tax=Cephalotrichum gorgonifer TaxID=2041049 RepID=A0AAE8N0P2_9PEZI|nr:uncharacterized protein DNG_05901 [Cephalotrichum gorgonifer]
MTDQPDASKGKAPVHLEQPSDAVKMAELDQSSNGAEAPSASDAQQSNAPAPSEPQPTSSDPKPSSSDAQPAAAEASSSNEEPPPRLAGPTSDKGKEPEAPAPPAKNSEQDTAIGDGSDDVAKTAPVVEDGPVCVITLLVPSGKKHPYKIDEKYLAKRNVNIPGTTESGRKDAFSISVYTLKELILREWRDDWEPAPPTPALIRLIHFGKILEDKEPLTKYKFSADTSNVVHMSVKPQDLTEEDEPKGGNKTTTHGAGSDSGSRCCVIL